MGRPPGPSMTSVIDGLIYNSQRQGNKQSIGETCPPTNFSP